MKVTVNHNRVPDVIAMPLAQNDTLEAQLKDLASRTGVEAQMLQNDFKAAQGEVFVLYALGNLGKKIYLIGTGKSLDAQSVFKAMQKFVFMYKSKLPSHLGLDLRLVPEADFALIAEFAVEGVLQGLYTIITPDKLVEKEKNAFGRKKSELELLVPSDWEETAVLAADRGQTFAEVRMEMMDLVNRPSNHKTPMQMAELVKKAGKSSGFSVKILEDAVLKAEGLDAIRCIGMGSDNPPALILMEYKPKGVALRGKKVVGLVGKGITFDTGGYSIKPSDNMGYMKSDMGGAAAVIGTFMAVARLNLPVRLVGAVPAAENMVSARAVKPGDITKSYSGKTIEIIDTDAEGRVVLADGLAYLIKNKKPDILIDLATLTGAIVRSLGYSAGGLFSENEQLVKDLLTAGKNIGDPLWHMPMFEEYGDAIKSDVADVKNYASQPPGGAIWAAKFLEVFTDNHPCWAHLDIAGVAFGSTLYGKNKAATAFGVRLLTEFLENMD